ncbi:Fatty acid oxidation complex subunit alpha [compost metagenome]
MGAVLGISFPTFRGGPLRHIDNLGVRHFVELADGYAQLGELYQVTAGLRRMADEEHSFF